MTYPQAVPVNAVTDEVVEVRDDINCRKCGYNLRGLMTDGRCPECGTSVAYSVRGDFIRYSDPDWVRGLRMGINLILAAIVLIILLTVGLAVLAGAFGLSPTAAQIFGSFTSLIVQALIFFGTWKLTEPDPSGLGEDQYGKVRQFIRIALLINVCGALLGLLVQFVPLPTAVGRMFGALLALLQLVGLAGFIAQLIYLSRLTVRLPDEMMSRRAYKLAWVIGITYGVILLAALVMGLFSTPTAGVQSPFVVLGAVLAIFGIILLIAGIMYLLLIERIGKRLKAEEKLARTTWAREVTA